MIFGAFVLDNPVQSFLKIEDHPGLSQLAKMASKSGEGWVVALAGLALALGLHFRRRTVAVRIVILIVLASLIAGASASITKGFVGRTRPNARAPQGFYRMRYEGKWIVGRYEFSSFPSGHAATVAGLAWAAWLLNRRLGLAASVYAALVCWSRVAQGAHHFSDVVAGTFLAIYISALVVKFLGPWVDKVIGRLERKPATG